MRRHRPQRIDLHSYIIQPSKRQQPTPRGIDSRGCAAGVWPASRATGPRTRKESCTDSKPRYTGILQILVERADNIHTHTKVVCRAATKDHTFASAQFHRFPT